MPGRIGERVDPSMFADDPQTPAPSKIGQRVDPSEFADAPAEQEEGNGWVRPALATAARVGGAVVGGLGGAALGGAGTFGLGAPAGLMAGGAAGGAAGEAVAEWIEGKGLSPTRIAVEGALGAIPAAKALTLPKAILQQGARGAGMNMVSAAANAFSENRLPTAGELGTAGVTGGVLGSALGGAAHKLQPLAGVDAPLPQKPSWAGPVEVASDMRADIASTPTTHVIDHNFTRTPKLEMLPFGEQVKYEAGRHARNVERSAADRAVDIRTLVSKADAENARINQSMSALQQQGIPAPSPGLPKIAGTKLDVGDTYDLVMGGQGGRTQAWGLMTKRVMDAAEQEGLLEATQKYLDISGMAHGAGTLISRTKNIPARQPNAANAFNRSDAVEKLMKGEALPGKMKTGDLRQSYIALRNSLSPADFTKVKAYADQFIGLNRKVLDEAKTGGLISDDAYTELTSKFGNATSPALQQHVRKIGGYVPLNRITVDPDTLPKGAGGALDLKNQTVVRQLDGSEQVTVDPLSAMAKRAEVTFREAGRNEIGQAFQQLHDNSPFARRVVHEVEGGAVSKPRPGYVQIGYLDSGKRVTLEVPEILEKALVSSAAEPMPGSTFMRIAHHTTQKLMTALSPAFSTVNAIRDASDTMSLNPLMRKWRTHDPRTWGPAVVDAAAFGEEWAKGFMSTLREDDTYLRYLYSRGANSGLFTQMALSQAERGKAPGAVLGKIQKFSEAVENAPKIAGMRQAEMANMPAREKALMMRRQTGSPDFAVRGTNAQNLNTLFTFFNASVQGVRRNYRELARNPQMVAKKLAPLALSAGTANIMLDRWNSQFTNPDSGLPEWNHISQAEKDANFVIITPATYKASDGSIRHKTVKWPKGHIDRLLHNPMQQALEAGREMWEGKEQSVPLMQRGIQTGLDVAENLLPGSLQFSAESPGDFVKSVGYSGIASLNPMVKPAFEIPTNTNTYQRTPIEPMSMQGLEKGERFRATTSASAKAVGQMTGDVLSPLQVEYLSKSLLPGIGEIGRDVIDVGLGQQKAQALPDPSMGNPERWSKMPGVGTIARRFLGSAIDEVDNDRQSKFYDALTTATQANRTLQHIAKDAPRFAQMSEEQKRGMALKAGLFRPLSAMASQLADIRKTRESLLLQQAPQEQLMQLRQNEKQLLAQIDGMLTRFKPALEGKEMPAPH